MNRREDVIQELIWIFHIRLRIGENLPVAVLNVIIGQKYFLKLGVALAKTVGGVLRHQL